MPANPAYQGADQNRTGVCEFSQFWQRRYGTAWRKRREEILEQRGSCCEVCYASGVDDGIRVHHLNYERFHHRIHAAERRGKRKRELDELWAAL